MYRIRWIVPEQVTPGSTFDASLVADGIDTSGDWSCPEIDGFACSVRLRVGVSVASAEWGDDVAGRVVGEFNSESEGVDGVRIGAAGHLNRVLSPGVGRELLHLELTVGSDVAPGSVLQIEFDDDPNAVFTTTQLPAQPYTHDATIEVTVSPSFAASESETPPVTEEETHPRWFTPVEGIATEGAEAGGPEPDGPGDPVGEAYCNYSEKGELKTDTQGYDEVTVTDLDSSGSIDAVDIKLAIADAISLQQNTVITVPAGTYDELRIKLTGLQAHLVLVSEFGPWPATPANATTFQGIGSKPAVTITGSLDNPAAKFTFGWHEADAIEFESPIPGHDPLQTNGWRGFELTNGYPQNLVIETVWTPIPSPPPGMIEVRGNYIHANDGPSVNASGLLVSGGAGPIDIIANDVSDCTTTAAGAGIRIEFNPDAQKVTIAKNFIHDNACTAPTLATVGGGVYVQNGAAVDLCGNFIDSNQAQRGAGIALLYTDYSTLEDIVYYLEANWIRFNVPHNDVGGRGGGIFVFAPDPMAATDIWHLGIVRNRVFNNGASDGGTYVVERGGGIDVSAPFQDAQGPFNLVDTSEVEGQLFIGNAIAGNTAKTLGGGIYFDASAVQDMQFWTNTIFDNHLSGQPASSRHGYGLYVASGVTSVVCSSNIVHGHNETSGIEKDWYASQGTSFGSLDYSCAADCYAGGTGDSPADLQPAIVTAPTLESNGNSLRYTAQQSSSITIDLGQDTLMDDTHTVFGYDYDGDVRHNGIPSLGGMQDMDIGADEWWDLHTFIRGDVNADGVFDISDPVFALATLFTPGSTPPTCPDAADANDDGAFDISDPVYILASLFVPGSPPPPAPHPGCGSDPTSTDGLECPAFDMCP